MAQFARSNNNFRGCYAGIGFEYDPSLDIFIEPTY